MVKKCKTIFCGEKWSIAEHFKFNNRNQEDGESASDFSIELQALAENCSFGNFLTQLCLTVAVLRDGAIKAKILNDAKDKPFDDIVKMAIASEMVDENIRVMDDTRNTSYKGETRKSSTAQKCVGKNAEKKTPSRAKLVEISFEKQ
jgi:hypothetical protein